jgi:hypothetical protein
MLCDVPTFVRLLLITYALHPAARECTAIVAKPLSMLATSRTERVACSTDLVIIGSSDSQ